MGNIVDYLLWRGDVSLEERPFNDADNLILATLAYMDFSGIVPGPGEGDISLGDACQQIIDLTGGSVASRVKSVARINDELIRLLVSSRRFKDMRLSNYVDEFDEARQLQFSAIQIGVSPTETYVAYRGTDSTLVGWREDFMVSFEVTQAQRRAVEYLEGVIRSLPGEDQRVYVGGHSKGGNLAVYAALECDEELSKRISCVWNNDGPGFAPEVMPASPYSQLGFRYRRIVPPYDMVGIIFEREDDPCILVKSSASRASQHDPLSWQVGPFGMVQAGSYATESRLIKESLDTWVKDIPLEQRRDVVNAFFDALEAGGAQIMSEVVENRQALMSVVNAMGDLPDSTKQLLRSFANLVISRTVDVAKGSAQDVAGIALKKARATMQELRDLAMDKGESLTVTVKLPASSADAQPADTLQ